MSCVCMPVVVYSVWLQISDVPRYSLLSIPALFFAIKRNVCSVMYNTLYSLGDGMKEFVIEVF